MGQHWRTSRETMGAHPSPGSPHGSKYALPSYSILSPDLPPLKRGKVAQALIDIAALLSGALLVCALGTAFGILGYVVYLKFLT